MMRLLLLLLVALAVLLWWKQRKRGAAQPPSPPPTKTTEAMLRCAHCGVHLPTSQALPGRGGSFCSAAHRSEFEAHQDGE